MTFRVVLLTKTVRGRWLNVYVDHNGRIYAGGAYASRRQADSVAKPHRWGCVWVDLSALGKVPKQKARKPAIPWTNPFVQPKHH